ncbi:hypothetical protein BOTBODRAFT_32320 [Botryobasidium botryosum FD-172 SS1]|uniref:THUMP domain-containing protein n=1 Tax=Botryobasidium botryosum (strain FD-172 SS1) TaxID=930990 RepID=A0A067MJR1_BOTB1|nr:hypothetical protein BOTBODRAFT_32320 [Botryobasidium botryosum FD-172 SS1]
MPKVRVEGPGVWVSCVKGKEKQTVGELYDLFESIADELWPGSGSAGADEGAKSPESPAVGGTPHDDEDEDEDEDEEEDLEKRIANELKVIKKPKKESRFTNYNTETACIVFVGCKAPVDPVKLVLTYLEQAEKTGAARTRFAQRFSPVSASCAANPQEILILANKLFPTAFESESDPPKSYRYKIELKIRNHSKIKKDDLVAQLAACVPKDRGHTVDLKNPELVILVEIFMVTCGMAVVPRYERYKRFNVAQIVESVHKERFEEGADEKGSRLDKVGVESVVGDDVDVKREPAVALQGLLPSDKSEDRGVTGDHV